MKFKIGDRVEITRYNYGNSRIDIGQKAKIISINDDHIGLKFEENVKGHTCDGKCLYGYGWFVNVNHIKRIKPLSWKEEMKR